MKTPRRSNENGGGLAWTFILGALVTAVLVAYFYTSAFPEFVESKFPFLKASSHQESAVATPTPEPTPEPTPVPEPEPVPAVAEVAPPPPPTKQLSDVTPEQLPKTVKTKVAMQFPAVANGKVIGSLSVAAGTEVRLLTVKDGKLGLEYRGGGGWHAPEETDVLDRIQTP